MTSRHYYKIVPLRSSASRELKNIVDAQIPVYSVQKDPFVDNVLVSTPASMDTTLSCALQKILTVASVEF